MLVAAAAEGVGDDNIDFFGIEVATGRVRWTIPAGEDGPFPAVAAMRFWPNSSLVEVALTDGHVLRLNALTGREQRRSLADSRTPEQKAGGWTTQLWEGTFSPDGRTLAGWGSGGWICAVGRRVRRRAQAGSRHSGAATWPSHPTAGRWRPRTSSAPTISARTRSD